MSRVRAANHGHRRVLAAVALLASLVLAILGLAVSGASAGPPPTSSTTTSESTTTTAPITTTTQRPATTTTPTTRRPASTTTSTAPATSTTAEPTTTLEETTTTSAEPTTTSTVAVTTPTTVESTPASSSSSGLSTDTKLAIIVGGLLAVAVAIAVLTILYWRHTRPVAVVDGLDDEEQDLDDPVAPVAAASGLGSVAAASSSADSAGGPPTEELPLFTDAAPGADVGTQSGSDGDVAAIDQTLFGPDPVEASPSSTAVTLEDLFGPSDETKGPAAR